MLRNLLYFIYPMRPASGAPGVEWRLNLKTLSSYSGVFNGKKIFVIAHDELSEDPLDTQAEILKSFPDAWFHFVRNDKELGEVVGFIPALELLASTDPNEATFYAHAKGVSYEDKPDSKETIRKWREEMYLECLSDIPKVESALSTFPCCGCRKKYGPWNPFAGVTWHYSGTFFWLKHSTLFSKPDWKFIYKNRFGVEVYPATHFRKGEGFCLNKDNHRDDNDFVNWVAIARAELAKRISTSDPAEPTVTLILPTNGRNTLERVLLEAKPQLGKGDEVLVVGDGPCPIAKSAVDAVADPRIKYLEYPDGPSGDWGHTPRNWAMPQASGSHVFHLDDDDACLPTAFANIRKAALECPGKILLFRTTHIDGREIGGKRLLALGQVSTQMFVVPNVYGTNGTWVSRYGGDFDYITQCIAKHPDGAAGVVWRDEHLAIHNGHGLTC